ALVKGVNGVVSRFDMLDLPGGDTLSPEGVVVNMGWVFLPCSSIEEFLANKDAYPAFADYVNGLGITGYDFDAVVRALGYVGDGALVGFLDGGSFEFMSPKAALVAASGNFGMGYQMLPAGWRQVVGVAVRREEQRDFPGRYSNSGDVTVAGEWVGFQPLTLDGALGDPTILSYAGTSYAAPLVSLYAALDLSRSAPQCRHLQPNEPPLTKSPELDVPLVDAIGACGAGRAARGGPRGGPRGDRREPTRLGPRDHRGVTRPSPALKSADRVSPVGASPHLGSGRQYTCALQTSCSDQSRPLKARLSSLMVGGEPGFVKDRTRRPASLRVIRATTAPWAAGASWTAAAAAAALAASRSSSYSRFLARARPTSTTDRNRISFRIFDAPSPRIRAAPFASNASVFVSVAFIPHLLRGACSGGRDAFVMPP